MQRLCFSWQNPRPYCRLKTTKPLIPAAKPRDKASFSYIFTVNNILTYISHLFNWIKSVWYGICNKFYRLFLHKKQCLLYVSLCFFLPQSTSLTAPSSEGAIHKVFTQKTAVIITDNRCIVFIYICRLKAFHNQRLLCTIPVFKLFYCCFGVLFL